MRAAPAVQAVTQEAGLWLWMQRGLQALTAASVTAWLAAWNELSLPMSLGLAWAAGLVVPGLLGRHAPPGPSRLIWDGACWTLEGSGGERLPGRVEPKIDLGTWMLWRFVPDGAAGARWLPLARRDAPQAWTALRAAAMAAAPAR